MEGRPNWKAPPSFLSLPESWSLAADSFSFPVAIILRLSDQ
jgi:hypothetical protein